RRAEWRWAPGAVALRGHLCPGRARHLHRLPAQRRRDQPLGAHGQCRAPRGAGTLRATGAGKRPAGLTKDARGRPVHIGTELMPRIGTPLSPSATRVLLCGSGDLGKEVVIELQRLGVEVVAVDRYADAPAMQVAHRSQVVDMLDGAALRAVIERERLHYIVPEIEAVATAALVELEAEGYTVIPTARGAQLTMYRE